MEATGNILFSGVGGQGILLASEITALGLLGAGFDVKKVKCMAWPSEVVQLRPNFVMAKKFILRSLSLVKQIYRLPLR